MMLSLLLKRIPALMLFLGMIPMLRAQGGIGPADPPYARFSDSLLVAGPSGAAAKRVYIPDSTIHYDFLTGEGRWAPRAKYSYHYRDDGLQKDLTVYAWSADSWVLYQREKYDYLEGQLIQTEIQYFDGRIWIPWRLVSYTRNTSGDALEQVVQDWDASLPGWKNRERYLFVYDTGQQLLSRTYQKWTDTGWENNHRYLFENGNGQVLGYTRQNWVAGEDSFLNAYRFVFEYDAAGLRLSDTQYNWGAGETWVPATRILYTYDAGELVIRKLYENYSTSGQSWGPVVDYLYFQNKNGQDTLILYRIWNTSLSVWQEDYEYRFRYGREGPLLRETWLDWKGGWVNDYRIDYYYTSEDQQLQVDITDSTRVSCPGDADGSARATASGGIPPYAFRWDDTRQSETAQVTGLSGGVWYHVTVTDAAMQVARDSIRLSEPPPVLTGPISGPGVADPGGAVYYSVPYEAGAVYQWSVEGGQLLSGQGGDQVEVEWTASGTGRISVRKTSPQGCPGNLSELEVDVRPLSVGRIPLSGETGIFPNPVPAGGLLTLSGYQVSDMDWTICNLTGQAVCSGKVGCETGSAMLIRIPDLPPGMYLLFFGGSSIPPVKLMIRQAY